jgi:hypothetical protein
MGLGLERTFIAWTIPNWITIVLMVAIAWLVFGLIAQAVGWSWSGSGSSSGFGGSASGVQPGGYIGASLLYGGATAGVSPLAG